MCEPCDVSCPIEHSRQSYTIPTEVTIFLSPEIDLSVCAGQEVGHFVVQQVSFKITISAWSLTWWVQPKDMSQHLELSSAELLQVTLGHVQAPNVV